MVLATGTAALARVLLLPKPHRGFGWCGADDAWAERLLLRRQLPAQLRRGLAAPKNASSAVVGKDRARRGALCMSLLLYGPVHPPLAPPPQNKGSIRQIDLVLPLTVSLLCKT